jgi:hypothetical protein
MLPTALLNRSLPPPAGEWTTNSMVLSGYAAFASAAAIAAITQNITANEQIKTFLPIPFSFPYR